MYEDLDMPIYCDIQKQSIDFYFQDWLVVGGCFHFLRFIVYTHS